MNRTPLIDAIFYDAGPHYISESARITLGTAALAIGRTSSPAQAIQPGGANTQGIFQPFYMTDPESDIQGGKHGHKTTDP